MKRFFPALLLCALGACSTASNAITQTGTLDSGTLKVFSAGGKIEAYGPAASDPKNRYTVTLSNASPAASRLIVNKEPHQVTACPDSCPPPRDAPSTDMLVRVPDAVAAQLSMQKGDIHVSDVPGPVDAVDENGDIKIQIPSYANARTVRGNISVLFGDANWPGDLHFSSMQGDVEVYVPANASARVDLRTEHGIIFTDFDLHGKAHGDAENIVGNIGGGGPRGVVIRVKTGNIRLLRLVPQM